MLKFNEFLAEEAREVIQVDARYLENNCDALNAELDALTEKPYQNAPIFLAQLRGVTERYGMPLPQSASEHFMDLNAELVYMLGESDYYLYVVYDTGDDGFVNGYAQVVDDDELEDLLDMDSEELFGDDDDDNEDEEKIRSSTWYAAREDDG